MELRLVYMTTRDREEARRIGRALVESRLAACVNILDPMNSFYWWNNQIQDDQETVLLAKTRADLVEALIAKFKSLHSYEVPCVVTLPILEGNPDFLAWVERETKR
jgi:periplasmic divalent cation tolerance protein